MQQTLAARTFKEIVKPAPPKSKNLNAQTNAYQ